MSKIKNGFMRLIREEDGATAVEYGVLIALIIAVCIVVIVGVGRQVNNAFERVNTALNAGVSGS